MKTVKKIFDMPLLSMGFRPFFIIVIFMAIVPTLIWVLQFTGKISLNYNPLTAYQWHANEMIFGFLFSAIIGFLLTASANWTGTRGIHGVYLFIIVFLFVLTRIVFWLTPFSESWPYMFIGTIVPLVLIIHLGTLFIRTNNKRNFVLLIPLLILVVGQILLISPSYKLGHELSIYSVRFIVVVIAGRVIPFFTSRALQLEPRGLSPLLERLNLLSVFLLIFESLYRDSGYIGGSFWIMISVVALFLNIYRFFNWRLISAFKVKILFILYVAYLWLIIHLALHIAVHLEWVSDFGKVDLHALTYGCMGTMILGMIHRVSLGHTGREIRAKTLSIIGYILISVGALFRVFGPLLEPIYYLRWLEISGTLWILSFLMIGFTIFPNLVLARADGKSE